MMTHMHRTQLQVASACKTYVDVYTMRILTNDEISERKKIVWCICQWVIALNGAMAQTQTRDWRSEWEKNLFLQTNERKKTAIVI